MRLLLALLLAITTPAVAGGRVTGVELGVDGQRLLLMTPSGVEQAPRVEGQIAFSEPKVSGDGRYVGWFALFPNCCTSYPIALALIVVGPDRAVLRLDGEQAAFGWCFDETRRAVVVRRAVLHGAAPEYFEMRSLPDGRLLRRYDMPNQLDLGVVAGARLPRWAECAAQ